LRILKLSDLCFPRGQREIDLHPDLPPEPAPIRAARIPADAFVFASWTKTQGLVPLEATTLACRMAKLYCDVAGAAPEAFGEPVR